jgi:predicted PurR-regulated permease PerM
MNTTWSRPTKYLIGVGLVILGIFILHLSRAVIPLLAMAALIAAVVRPAILWLHLRVHLPLGLAVGLVYLGLAIMVPLIIVLIIPPIADALVYVGNLDYQSILQRGADWLRSTLITIKSIRLPVAGFNAYIDKSIDTLLEEFQSSSSSTIALPSLSTFLQPLSSALRVVMETGANVVGTVVAKAAMVAFLFLASIYISLDAHTFRAAFLNGVPEAYRPEISILLARVERVWHAFFHGELELMAFIGVITTIGLLALGMPGGLYLGIIAGLLEVVPSFGPLIATIPAVIAALIQGSAYLPISHLAFAGLIILFYILLQQVENQFISPRVLGGALELPLLIVMTGVVVGATVGGILGALLATPIIATGREILSYIRCKISNQEYALTEPTVAEKSAPDVKKWLNSKLVEIQQLIKSRSSKRRKGGGEE